jgi:hypothetical protein
MVNSSSSIVNGIKTWFLVITSLPWLIVDLSFHGYQVAVFMTQFGWNDVTTQI